MEASRKAILDKVQTKQWERWLERPYGTFVLSLFAHANSRRTMEAFGIKAEYRSCLFQDNWWYESPDVTIPFAKQLKAYLRGGGSIIRLIRSCEANFRQGLKKIRYAASSKIPLNEQLKIFRDAEAGVVPFIWLAHGFDDVYTEWLEREVPKYIHTDIATYIGDATLPKKLTATGRMESAMRQGVRPEQIVESFGWIKARTGFSNPFTIQEVRAEQVRLRRTTIVRHRRPAIPVKLRKLVGEAREIVYLRTLRTDAIFEMLFRARPIMKRAAQHFGLSFQQLADYSIHDLLSNTVRPYPRTIFATDGDDFAFFKTPLVKASHAVSKTVSGTVAYQGVARGRVRIMRVAADGKFMKSGEILVAPMTFPSFIMAMQRASAFVTDEGGLTCHAAIVAREMHKPCIVGTKHATRVLKNGDLVEVDAIKGVVRKV